MDNLWFSKAEQDFEEAEFLRKNNRFLTAAFLYQQCVEKSLKSLLIATKKGLQKTHDCFMLAKLLNAPASITKASGAASLYYTRTRYPDAILVTLTRQEIDDLSSSAKEVLEWTRKKLC